MQSFLQTADVADLLGLCDRRKFDARVKLRSSALTKYPRYQRYMTIFRNTLYALLHDLLCH
jgi:hypothetical protein